MATWEVELEHTFEIMLYVEAEDEESANAAAERLAKSTDWDDWDDSGVCVKWNNGKVEQ